MSQPYSPSSADLRPILKKFSNDELIDLVIRAVSLAPEIRHLFDHDPDEKDSSALVEEALDAISEAVADPDWEEWHDTGVMADYEPVRQALQALQMAGFSEEVLELGLVLIRESRTQIDEFDEDEEICNEVFDCMDVVLAAFHTVDWPSHRKLLWLREAILADWFSVTDGFKEETQKTYSPEDWSLVASTLLKRMDSPDEKHNPERGLAGEIERALEKAGRDSEILDFYKKAAENAGYYLRLVELLLAKENYDEAQEWIHKGLAVTKGITAGRLRDRLIELHTKQDNWNEALFLQTEDFVQYASLEHFKSCHFSAEKLNIWPAVRTLLMDFLIEGKMPWDQDAWPFQNRSSEIPDRNQQHPHFDLLIDLAMYENNPAEVLKWYDLKPEPNRFSTYAWSKAGQQTDAVAGAVQNFAPERAIALWKKLAEEEIAQTKPEAYKVAGRYLRKMGNVMGKNDMTAKWNDYIQSLRTLHRRKKRLMEVLDGLS